MNFLRSGGVHFFVISIWWHSWKKILTFQEKVTLVTPSTKVPTIVHGRAVVKVLLGHCNKSPVFSDSCLEHYFLQPFQRKNKFRFGGWVRNGSIRIQSENRIHLEIENRGSLGWAMEKPKANTNSEATESLSKQAAPRPQYPSRHCLVGSQLIYGYPDRGGISPPVIHRRTQEKSVKPSIAIEKVKKKDFLLLNRDIYTDRWEKWLTYSLKCLKILCLEG